KMNQLYAVTYEYNPKDPIGSLARNLVSTINDGTVNRTITIYNVLEQQIKQRGNNGKDIRYIKRELHNLYKQAKVKAESGVSKEERVAAEKICNLADSYINQLPKASDDENKSTLKSGLEEAVENIEEK
ncbi:MAG: hypothetical protein V1831_00890, partial [Candidatus Woesearchaeota archaeon]